MAVRDFIPLMEAKQTVEKEVRQKPRLAELTKIEYRGKVVEENFLDEENEEETKKRRKRKKISEAEPDKIERVGNQILIITEKPQAAQKISVSLGKAKKITEKGAYYFSVESGGKKIFVASAVGHLFNLNYKSGQVGWPVFEVEWIPAYKKESASFTKKYYDLLKKLAKKSSEIIIATDYDVEGEVIGWNVLRFICNRANAKRMKFSTLTKEELKNSFLNPLQELDWGNAYAGETRHILDWFYGINLSRALMSAIKTAGSFKILSIGRVQGPALKIIVDREKEIMNFKPQPYWQVFAVINGLHFKHPKDIFKKEELKKFESINEGIAETSETEENIPPPHPFDLTTLQKEVYRVHKINPSQTLAIAQRLYLEGLISYPRTSSQKIPFSIEPKKILKNLEKIFPKAKEATREKPIEGKKTDPAHPSIYPTGEYKKIPTEDKKVYDLIAKRFISAFYRDAIVENKKVTIQALDSQEIIFKSSGLKIKDAGWSQIYPIEFEEKDIPTLKGKVKIDAIKFEEKETQPPKRYTPASLITTLEKKNLGTKATRSIIVDTLFERGYIEGQSIKATPLGIKLIETLEKNSPIIIDESLTRNFEEQMEEFSGKNSLSVLQKKEEDIVDKAKEIIINISKDFKANEIQIGKAILEGIQDLRNEQKENNTLNVCPACNKGNLRIMFTKKTNQYFIGCSNYPECKKTFSLPRNALIKKAEKNCEECSLPKLLAIRKGKRPWEFCFNPSCAKNKKNQITSQ